MQSTVGTGGYAYSYGDYAAAACSSGGSTSCVNTSTLCAAGSTALAGATYACYGSGFGFNTGGVAIGTTGVSLTLSGTLPAGGGQIILVSGATSYCALFTTAGAQTIPYSMFSTTCYTPTTPGTVLPAGSTVDKLNVQVSSSSTVTQTWSLCLAGVKF
jgi:hypothetical protein